MKLKTETTVGPFSTVCRLLLRILRTRCPQHRSKTHNMSMLTSNIDMRVCSDCLFVEHFAPSELDNVPPERIAQVTTARQKMNMLSMPFAGDPETGDYGEGHFSMSACELCDSKLGGDRFDVVAVCAT